MNNGAQVTKPTDSSMTILYVDTDKTTADTYIEYFTGKGHNLFFIRDPRAISQNIKMRNPDVLLMEIVYGHINGDDVIRGLRKKGLTLPIVVLSQTVSKKMLMDMKQYRVDGFYIKPISPEVLEKRLQVVLSSYQNTKQRKSGIPAVLIMTGNSNLNAGSYETFPLSIIDEYGFNIMFAYTLRDAVELLKSPKNGIRLIMVDGNDPAYIEAVLQLLGIIQRKMKLPLFVIAESVSDTIKNTLGRIGIKNIIDKSDESDMGSMAGFRNELMYLYEMMSQRTAKKRDKIIKDLSGISSLPPLPDIYLKIEALATDKNATVADYGKILELDPAITARILRMSNSALYSFKRKINTVKDAVALMGTREILSLVRLVCITGNMRTSPEVESHTRKIWKHSSICAIAAIEVYDHIGVFSEEGLHEELFIGGIIHDMGKIVLASVFPGTFVSYIREADPATLWNLSGEKMLMGVNHCEIGMRLAEHWKLPQQFREVIAYHHDPSWNYDSDLLKAIHLGNYISHYISDELTGSNDIDADFLEATGLTMEKLYEFAEKHGEDIHQKSSIVTRMISG